MPGYAEPAAQVQALDAHGSHESSLRCVFYHALRQDGNAQPAYHRVHQRGHADRLPYGTHSEAGPGRYPLKFLPRGAATLAQEEFFCPELLLTQDLARLVGPIRRADDHKAVAHELLRFQKPGARCALKQGQVQGILHKPLREHLHRRDGAQHLRPGSALRQRLDVARQIVGAYGYARPQA